MTETAELNEDTAMVDVGLYDGSGGGEVVQVQNQLEMMRRWKTEHVSVNRVR
jgi:hypothetical protein